MNISLNEEELRRIIAQGETMRVDFKAPMAWEGATRGALAEDIVAMANVRDGGVVLIGVSEGADGSPQVAGVTSDQAATFDPTKVGEYVASHFQPPPRLQIERPILEGKQLIVLRVSEFETTPIVCIKDGPEKYAGSGKRMFYAGNVIIRNTAAKSEVIRSAEDMHALIRLAVSKTSNQLLADFRRVLDGDQERLPAPPHLHQLGLEIWSKELDEYRKKWTATYPRHGTFSMVFLPGSKLDQTLDHAAMKKLVQESQVEWHGWKIPTEIWPSSFSEIQNRAGAVQGTLDLQMYQELWHMRDTGAFMHARLHHYVKHGTDGIALPLEDVIHPVILGLGFAKRLYQELIPDGHIDYEFALMGIKGQRLGSFDSFAMHGFNHRASEEIISSHGTCSILDLRSAWQPIARRILKDIFSLFSWDNALPAIDQHISKYGGKAR